MGSGTSRPQPKGQVMFVNSNVGPAPMAGRAGPGAPGIPPPPRRLPMERTAWQGPKVEHHMIDLPVAMKGQYTMGAVGQGMLSTDLALYYEQLKEQYGKGYHLSKFVRIPGPTPMSSIFTLGNTIPYQGIFRKVDKTEGEGMYDLHVEKAEMITQRMYTGMPDPVSLLQSKTVDALSSLVNNTQGGARLVSVEVTGTSSAQGTGTMNHGYRQRPAVDMYFHIPVSDDAPVYQIQTVMLPVPMAMSSGMNAGGSQYQINWQVTLNKWLAQGFRLVDIFMEYPPPSTSVKPGMMAGNQDATSVWFFEKEGSLLNEPSPIYEGKVVAHQHKAAIGNSSSSWGQLLQHMGLSGWEVAAIVETGSQTQGTMITGQTLQFFFQRKILKPNAHDPNAPPPYSAK